MRNRLQKLNDFVLMLAQALELLQKRGVKSFVQQVHFAVCSFLVPFSDVPRRYRRSRQSARLSRPWVQEGFSLVVHVLTEPRQATRNETYREIFTQLYLGFENLAAA